MRNHLIIIILLFPIFAWSQYRVTGTVADRNTQRALPFVNVTIPSGLGTTTDIDGRFSITVPSQNFPVHFSYVGYGDTTVIPSQQPLTIFLRPRAIELRDAIVTNQINPALRIVDSAIINRDRNNPEKNVAFRYESYNKMAFGPNVTNQTLIDSIAQTTSGDSGYVNYLTAMNLHYLFFTESVTERNFSPPDRTYERVIGNRFSGLKHPTFSLIASEFQPFSFYQDYVSILSLKYVSPLARNSYKNYDFELVKTELINHDTLFTITFQPKEKSTFNGLNGILTINSHGYALQNIKVDQSNPQSNTEIHLEQMSAFIDSTQWFPVQFNTHIVFLSNNEDNSMPGLDVINGRGKTYLKNIQLNPEFSNQDFSNVILEITDSAHLQSNEFWAKHRNQNLTPKEATTYAKVDSIGEKHNLDKKLKFFEGLTTGLIPIGKVSIVMKDLLDYNSYEGVRLGIGLRTNNEFSKYFSVGGYTGYGLKDNNWKYGADLQFNLHPRTDVYAGVSYVYDVVPSGDAEFHMKEPFNLRSYTNLFLRRLDWREGTETYLKARMFKDVQAKFFYGRYNEWYPYNYAFRASNEKNTQPNVPYNRAEIGTSFRFGYKEKYVRSFNQNISLGTKYPYVYGRVAYSNENIGADYNYVKVDVKIIKTLSIKGAGDLGFSLKAGQTFGDAPAPFLYYAKGMYIDGFNLYIENAFNTMQPNEFLNDKYLTVHVHHKFGALFKTDFSMPQISLVSAAGWGSLNHPEHHQDIAFKTMQKGFFESGLILDKILVFNTSGIGVAGFYRYGPYGLENTLDNLSFRMSLSYVLQ